MHIAITLLFALLIACTPQPLEQFDPEATYVGGDSACAKFSEIFPNLRQSSLFDDEVREQVKLIRDLSVNSEPSIRRASEEFLRSFSFEGQMSLPGAIQSLRDACTDLDYME